MYKAPLVLVWNKMPAQQGSANETKHAKGETPKALISSERLLASTVVKWREGQFNRRSSLARGKTQPPCQQLLHARAVSACEAL